MRDKFYDSGYTLINKLTGGGYNAGKKYHLCVDDEIKNITKSMVFDAAIANDVNVNKSCFIELVDNDMLDDVIVFLGKNIKVIKIYYDIDNIKRKIEEIGNEGYTVTGIFDNVTVYNCIDTSDYLKFNNMINLINGSNIFYVYLSPTNKYSERIVFVSEYDDSHGKLMQAHSSKMCTVSDISVNMFYRKFAGMPYVKAVHVKTRDHETRAYMYTSCYLLHDDMSIVPDSINDTRYNGSKDVNVYKDCDIDSVFKLSVANGTGLNDFITRYHLDYHGTDKDDRKSYNEKLSIKLRRAGIVARPNL